MGQMPFSVCSIPLRFLDSLNRLSPVGLYSLLLKMITQGSAKRCWSRDRCLGEVRHSGQDFLVRGASDLGMVREKHSLSQTLSFLVFTCLFERARHL